MTRWLRFYYDLCLLKAAPQDAPGSKNAFYTALFVYLTIGTFITSFSQGLVVSVIVALLQAIIFIFITNLIMWVKKTPERFFQTVTALMGSGALLALVAIPVVYLGTSTTPGVEQSAPVSFLWMISILILVWETVVIGNILRHAMEIPLLAGVGVALIYMYLSFAVTLRIVKVTSFPMD